MRAHVEIDERVMGLIIKSSSKYWQKINDHIFLLKPT
jgi:hypothetical protein